MVEFPVIDLVKLASQKGDDGERLMAACSLTGFFYVTNHGIPRQDIDGVFNNSREVFDLPLDVKEEYIIKNNVGYIRVGRERVVTMDIVEHKEAFNFPSSFNLATSNQLPPTIKQNRQETEAFTRACHAVGCKILRALAIGLGLDSEYFIKGHTYGNDSGGIFRLLKYPGVPDTIDSASATRAGSHSDFGTLTLLFQESPPNDMEEKASGFQVNVNDMWHDVPSKKDCIVVNIADLLSFWTEGRLRSAVHRVILPEGEQRKTPRYSTVYFMMPDDDHILQPIHSALPSPSPAKLDNDGHLIASFGPCPFTYNQSGKVYLWRRLGMVYDFAPTKQLE